MREKGGGIVSGEGGGVVAYSRVGGPQSALIWRGEGGRGGVSISGHPRRSTRLSPHSSHTSRSSRTCQSHQCMVSLRPRHTRPPGARAQEAPGPHGLERRHKAQQPRDNPSHPIRVIPSESSHPSQPDERSP